MPSLEFECKTWSNEKLILEEIIHRRSIAAYVTALALTGASTVASAGALAPLALPIGAFKAYKIRSHKLKLQIVRAELARRFLSPPEKRKRDVVVPVVVAFTVYVATLGLADIIDIVPSDVQGELNAEVEAAAGVDQGTGGLDEIGDQYQAFIIAEAMASVTHAAMKPRLPPRPSQHPAYEYKY